MKVKFSFIPAPTSVERDGCKDLVHNSTKTGNECAQQVSFTFDGALVHVFDPETEQNLEF